MSSASPVRMTFGEPTGESGSSGNDRSHSTIAASFSGSRCAPRDALDPAFADELDEAPVRELGDGELGDQVGDLPDAERAGEQVARARHERVAPVRLDEPLLGLDAIGDLHRRYSHAVLDGEPRDVPPPVVLDLAVDHAVHPPPQRPPGGQDLGATSSTFGPSFVCSSDGRRPSSSSRERCCNAAIASFTRAQRSSRVEHPQPDRRSLEDVVDHETSVPETARREQCACRTLRDSAADERSSHGQPACCRRGHRDVRPGVRRCGIGGDRRRGDREPRRRLRVRPVAAGDGLRDRPDLRLPHQPGRDARAAALQARSRPTRRSATGSRRSSAPSWRRSSCSSSSRRARAATTSPRRASARTATATTRRAASRWAPRCSSRSS